MSLWPFHFINFQSEVLPILIFCLSSRLIPFPGRKKEPERRKMWKTLINHEKDKKLWSPG